MPTALIVDDSTSSRTLLRGILTQQGMSTVEAKDGTEALLRLAETATVDLLLLDLHMEPMDGMELLRQMRTDARFATIPALLITAEASRSAVVEAAALGIAGYIIKPFDKGKVAERIRALGLDGTHA
jgi:two-component system chemotaxis response regulator CheY